MNVIREELKAELKSMQTGLLIITGRKAAMVAEYGEEHVKLAKDRAAVISLTYQTEVIKRALSPKKYGAKFLPYLDSVTSDTEYLAQQYRAELDACTGPENQLAFLRTLTRYHANFASKLSAIVHGTEMELETSGYVEASINGVIGEYFLVWEEGAALPLIQHNGQDIKVHWSKGLNMWEGATSDAKIIGYTASDIDICVDCAQAHGFDKQDSVWIPVYATENRPQMAVCAALLHGK
ncbi:hypothetical protein [Ktedonospora formicarum]|uniref:Uncharacterized protein n=1 Tax=Ktedonospora formicarum TaxID=2778364 RepID=A0A8J3I5J7_9CHLR|nr:hypothetical protein [Ktedonospora formicarum]GHO45174.1 hypothetical protein KSX_33370 [Ktedonospora formicarum]